MPTPPDTADEPDFEAVRKMLQALRDERPVEEREFSVPLAGHYELRQFTKAKGVLVG
jgi:hypothetical protein